jgi:hypothetical protein
MCSNAIYFIDLSQDADIQAEGKWKRPLEYRRHEDGREICAVARMNVRGTASRFNLPKSSLQEGI